MNRSVCHYVLSTLCVGVLLSAAAPAENIVVNGSFELPAVTDSHKWDIYGSIPGWQLVRGPSIELQRGVNGWLPADGDQLIELDSDIDGPGGGLSGEDASSAIYQDLLTPLGSYVLTFAFSPRPGVADNALEIVWDGAVVDTLVADGSGLSNTDWTYHSYPLTATSETTRLEFGDLSVSDSLGTFVDDVCVSAQVPEPASILVLLAGLTGAFLRRRT